MPWLGDSSAPRVVQKGGGGGRGGGGEIGFQSWVVAAVSWMRKRNATLSALLMQTWAGCCFSHVCVCLCVCVFVCLCIYLLLKLILS